jgi:hypothetical protein
MVLLCFQVVLNLYIIPKQAVMRIKGALEEYYLLSKVNTLNGHKQVSPKGKSLGSHMIG